jgi:hypothetical protein
MGAGKRWISVGLITMLVCGALATGSAEAAPLLTAPSAQITSGPPSEHGSRTATFTFSSDDPTATFQCRLDGALYAACSSPKTYSGLSQASHLFEVRAVDLVGNAGSPAQWSFSVVGPETTITAGPSGSISTRSATFSFTGSAMTVRFECSLDGAAFSACASPGTYSGLSEGSHVFRVRAVGNEDLVDTTPAQRSFSVVGPETTITDGPSGRVTSRSNSFSFSGSGSTVGFECSLDGAAFSPCTSPTTYSDLTVDVSHTFQVRAVGEEGLLDATPASRTFAIEPAADLSVELTATPRRVKPKGTLTYVVRVTDLGPDAATSIFSVLELPGGATFQSISSPDGSCAVNGGETAYCQTEALPVGASATMTVTVKVTASTGLEITALAWAVSAEFDPQESNSSATVTTRVGNK